jgi:hypothetical protein
MMQRICNPVDLPCVEAGVGEDDLEVAGRGRVAFPRCRYIPFNAV